MKTILYKSFYFPVILFFMPGICLAQNYTTVDFDGKPEVYNSLPKKVNEASGVIIYEKHLWTFNDSGGEPEIYKIGRKSGKVKQTVRLENGKNRDWEDIAQDKNHIYIGDFGNNKGNRKDLVIYKIRKSEIGKGKYVTLDAEPISFSYGDQTDFTIKRQQNNFDCEAVTDFGDSLIIFSKDWEDYMTRMYKLPKKTGQYKVDPVSVFDVGGLVTGVDYNGLTGNLVLVGYMDYVPFVVLLEGFTGRDFNAGKIHRINFPEMKGAQTEGVAWLDDNSIVVTCESTKRFEQSAYKINLMRFVAESNLK